ncbi:MAG: DUF134 domain-containing protein [Candidatus Methanofastidiosia archaeon]
MPRPRQCRRVRYGPKFQCFKPRGIALQGLEEINLTVDELEAVRLVDLEDKDQNEASQIMNVSQPTLHRTLKEARRKIVDALVSGKALIIDGGNYIMVQRKFHCYDCGHQWEVPFGTPRPQTCPSCGSTNIHRAPEDRGYARGQGRGAGRAGRGGRAGRAGRGQRQF